MRRIAVLTALPLLAVGVLVALVLSLLTITTVRWIAFR